MRVVVTDHSVHQSRRSFNFEYEPKPPEIQLRTCLSISLHIIYSCFAVLLYGDIPMLLNLAKRLPKIYWTYLTHWFYRQNLDKINLLINVHVDCTNRIFAARNTRCTYLQNVGFNTTKFKL